ncbi:uncharacterized protein PAC_15044 [Phialocephala subalpina]|uniref:Uncharacterized protein n=1 Tax=Phialocephala subalpina TaxID=576137 RepID=A0A1L7XJG0_9HELO|nr:uncharacterized protein PAC_15044 [Phialocephala subalpina]
MCFGTIFQCVRCGTTQAPIPAQGPGRCDAIGTPDHVVLGPSVGVPTCSFCQNPDMQTVLAHQEEVERELQDVILRDQELQRVQALEAENQDVFPDSFKDWCMENNDTHLPDGLSAESALDADIVDYLEYLLDGPFDLEYRDEVLFRVEEMRASERANFDFVPWEQPHLMRFQRWKRVMEVEGNFLVEEADPSRQFQRIVTIYAENLSPLDQVSFMAARESLAINDRLELYGEHRQDHTIGPRGEWIPLPSSAQTSSLEDLMMVDLNLIESFAAWTSRQHPYQSMFNDVTPRKALMRDIKNYQGEIITSLGPTPKALAWYNLVHNIQLAAEQLFDFHPPVEGMLSFRNFGVSKEGVESVDSFDDALVAYESYLMAHYPDPKLLDAFRTAVNALTVADRSQLQDLPRVDRTTMRLSILSNHLTHLLNQATAAGLGAKVQAIVLPAQQFVMEAIAMVKWPFSACLELLQSVFDQGWNVVAPGSDVPGLGDEEFAKRLYEYEELGWDIDGSLRTVRKYWTAFEG